MERPELGTRVGQDVPSDPNKERLKREMMMRMTPTGDPSEFRQREAEEGQGTLDILNNVGQFASGFTPVGRVIKGARTAVDIASAPDPKKEAMRRLEEGGTEAGLMAQRGMKSFGNMIKNFPGMKLTRRDIDAGKGTDLVKKYTSNKVKPSVLKSDIEQGILSKYGVRSLDDLDANAIRDLQSVTRNRVSNSPQEILNSVYGSGGRSSVPGTDSGLESLINGYLPSGKLGKYGIKTLSNPTDLGY